jgi:hypothetical protein
LAKRKRKIRRSAQNSEIIESKGLFRRIERDVMLYLTVKKHILLSEKYLSLMRILHMALSMESLLSKTKHNL